MEDNLSHLPAMHPQSRTGGSRVFLKVSHDREYNTEEAHGELFVFCFFEKQAAYLGFGSYRER